MALSTWEISTRFEWQAAPAEATTSNPIFPKMRFASRPWKEMLSVLGYRFSG